MSATQTAREKRGNKQSFTAVGNCTCCHGRIKAFSRWIVKVTRKMPDGSTTHGWRHKGCSFAEEPASA